MSELKEQSIHNIAAPLVLARWAIEAYTCETVPRIYVSIIIVDTHSKQLEVIPMSTTERTMGVLHSTLTRYGLPEELVSDNELQFTSVEFELYMKANGIKHIQPPPYHPALKEEAERFV